VDLLNCASEEDIDQYLIEQGVLEFLTLSNVIKLLMIMVCHGVIA